METGTFLVLEGCVPDDVYLGQRVHIGYSDPEGLYANPGQTVQVSYYVEDNLLMGFIVDWLIPFHSTGADLQIVDVQSNGSQLVYNVAA